MKSDLVSTSTLYWAAAGVIAGGIVHILTIFWLPQHSADLLTDRIRRAIPANEMVVLPLVTPDTQLLPFMAPDVRYALCRFDLANGPLSIRTPLLDGAWTVTIYDGQGRGIYTASGADLQRRDVELVLTATDAAEAGAIPFDKSVSVGAITVSVPTTAGLTIIRAPIFGPAYAPEIDRGIAEARCAPKIETAPGRRNEPAESDL